MTGGRAGFALLDVTFATLVFAVGGLAAAGLMVHSSRIASAASELRQASGRLVEVSDSLMWTSSVGAGQRLYADGRVQWTPAGAMVHLQGWGADTTGLPIAELWSARW